MRARLAPVIGTFVATFLVCASDDARADYEAGVFGGVHFFSEKNRLGRYDLDPATTAYTSTGTFGGRFAYLPIPYLGIEAQVSVIPTSTQDDRTSATIIHARAHLMGNLPLGRLRPFVLAGAGSATVIPNDPIYLRRDTDLNVHAGVGARYDVDKLWGVRVDVQSAAVPRTDRDGFALETTVLLGVYGNFPWPPTPPLPFDKDHDQITDDKDECPDKAGDIRFGGCPDPNAKEEESEEEDSGGDEKGGDSKKEEKDEKDPKADPKEEQKPAAPAQPEGAKP